MNLLNTPCKKILVSVLLSLTLLIISSFNSYRLPQANQKVLEYVETVLGKKVGTGECSDLIFNAQFHLKKEKINSNTKTKKILPGDFISFQSAIFKDDKNNELHFGAHHAIIYRLINVHEIIIVHQNHNNYKIVQKLDLNLNNLTSGKFEIKHP